MGTKVQTISKVVHPGFSNDGHIFCKIEYDGTRLSISGVEGPKRNGDAKGSCGQINPIGERLKEINDGWDSQQVSRFDEIWEHWHLNDMRAGCEHQRAAQWDKHPLDPSKPLNAYIKHPNGSSGWNMLGWVPEKDGGYLCKPCPECGYKYGTAWKTEQVPDDVIAFLALIPETDITPAWV